MHILGKLAALCATALILALAALIAPASAQGGSGSVAGVVINATTGATIAGAKITLNSGSQSFATTSDDHGAFRFSDVPAGGWSLRTTADEYQLNVSSSLLVAVGQELDVAVQLQPVSTTNITTLGKVIVRGHATLNTSSAPVVTISATQFIQQNASQIQSVLETTPGITIEHYDNGAPGNVTTFTIRGAGGFVGGGNTGYEVLVLQDGEPIRNGQYGDSDLSGLTPAIYSNVEVVKGVGGTSLFGANSIGGTLNLVTIDPRATEGAESLISVGGYGTTQFNLADTNTSGRFGYVLDYHTYGTDGYIPSQFKVDAPPYTFSGSATTPPIGTIEPLTEAMTLRSGLGKIRYDFSKSSYGVLTVTDEADWRDQFGLLGNPESVFLLTPGQSYSKDPLGYPYFFGFPMNYVWNTNPKYSLDYHTDLGGGGLVVRYFDDYINRWVDGNNAPAANCCFLQKSNDHITGELASWEKVVGNSDLTFALGGNGDTFQYGSCGTQVACVGFTAFPYYPADKQVPASEIIPTSGTQIEKTILVRDDYELSQRFTTTIAGYYSDYNDLNVKRFDPRLAIVNRPDQNSVIRLSVASGFAAPRLSDIVTPLNNNVFTSVGGPDCPSSGDIYCNGTSGNPNIKEETALGYDLGYQRTWGLQGNFSVDLYRTDLHNHIFDAIVPAPPGSTLSDGSTPMLGIQEPINLAGTVYTGIELAGTMPISDFYAVKAYYNTQAAYPTAVDPVTEAAIGNVVNDQQFLGVPLHKLGYSANFQNRSGASGYFGGDWYGPNNAYNVPQFWIYNAGVALPFTGNTKMHIVWTNIFNKNAPLFSQYQQGVPYPAAPGYICSPGNPPCASYLTNSFSAPPHMLSISFDTRIGSLR